MSPSPDAVRVAIAGAASLRGKELKQLLEESNFPASEIRLLDEEIVAGTLTEAGGEPAVIETVDEDSFERVRFAFFTGSPGFSVRPLRSANAPRRLPWRAGLERIIDAAEYRGLAAGKTEIQVPDDEGIRHAA